MTGTTDDRPLVTFAVIAYNQERFIREAIEGAFAQTYQPLEIILSDDGSPDRTYEIMQEMAAAYDGPHRVRLNRNEPNLGLALHLNRIESLATSDIVILAAGDDISRPGRSAAIAASFRENSDLAAVFSDVATLGSGSQDDPATNMPIEIIGLNSLLYYGGGAGVGAGYAYRRGCFKWPWPLPAHIFSEDRILPLRAVLLGQVGRIREPLLFYRRDNAGLTSKIRQEGRVAILYPEHALEVERTLQAAEDAGMMPPAVLARARRFYRRRRRLARMRQKRGSYGDGLVRVFALVLDTLFNRRYRLDRSGSIDSYLREKFQQRLGIFHRASSEA